MKISAEVTADKIRYALQTWKLEIKKLSKNLHGQELSNFNKLNDVLTRTREDLYRNFTNNPIVSIKQASFKIKDMI